MVSIKPFEQESALILENEAIRAVVLPLHGGKVTSLYSKKKEFELLFQNPKGSYSAAEPYAPFEEYEACGFDDAFPTIDACEMQVGDRMVAYPDHGEIWSAPFDFQVRGDRVLTSWSSSILPYAYFKEFSLEQNCLKVSYRITNTGRDSFPYLWAFHCLVNYRSDMRLLYPEGVTELVNAFDSEKLDAEGTAYRFPKDRLRDGSRRDFTAVPPALPPSEEKFYVKGKVGQGRCGYFYPAENVTAQIEFDPEKLPYLGFWCTAGGYRGDYNCALEPASGYYDRVDKTLKNRAGSILHAGETLNFELKIRLS
jgi:galactose mutarotase-like enzyme